MRARAMTRRWRRCSARGGQRYISADRLAEEHLPQVRERFGRFELVVLDEDVPVAAGWAVPIRRDWMREGLPSGYGDSLRGALEEKDEAATLVVCAAQVHPDRIGAGTLLGRARGRDAAAPRRRRHPRRSVGRDHYSPVEVAARALWNPSDVID